MDILLTSTASSGYVLTRTDLELVMSQRNSRPLFIIDIAVPRDIEPTAREIAGLHLFDIDDLREAAAKNLKEREKEAIEAEKIIDQEVELFQKRIHLTMVKPIIVALKSMFEEIRGDELRRHAKDMERLSDRDRLLVEHLTNSIVNRLLHMPLCTLKTDLILDVNLPPIEVVERMFGLTPLSRKTCEMEEDPIQ
jgi:glutamyl-tRNA reductase